MPHKKSCWPPPRSGAVWCALLLGLALVGCGGPSQSSPRAASPPATHRAPATPGATLTPAEAAMQRAVEAFLPEAERFVEQHRGLRFTRPVAVTVLDDEPFRKRLEALPGDSPADLEKTAKELRALGLVKGRLDLAALEKALLGDAVAGFYDPPTHNLVVRGGSLTPWVRQVVVHELTHALQDQAFNINRPQVDSAPDEQGIAFHSLLEGDAVRIENTYHQAMSAADRQRADEEEAASGIPEDTPPVLIEELTFPYTSGPPFVTALLDRHGQSGLDAAFAKPPTTTSQVIHPERYLSGRDPVHVDPPPADGPVFDRGAFGEEAVRLVLERAVRAGRLSDSEADAAASSWAGDWASAWDAGPQACIRIQLVTLGASAPLVRALHAYASIQPGSRVTGDGPVTLTSCG